MKTKIIAAIALCGTAIAPIMSTAAFATATQVPSADGPDSTTSAAMDAQCAAFAAADAAAFVGTTADPSVVGSETTTLNSADGSVTDVVGTQVGDPSEIGTRSNPTNVVPTGTFVPSATYIAGNPFRIGGSPNLFGNQRASAGYYPSSTYDYTANFVTTFSYAFNCPVVLSIHHHEVTSAEIPAVPGHHIDNPAKGGDNANDCVELDLHGADIGVSGPGQSNNCLWVDTVAATPAEYSEADTDTTNPHTGVPVTQDETDTLTGHEANGPAVQVTGDIFVRQVVVCNSPGSKGGAWRPQNGYGGANCNTTYFNSAPLPPVPAVDNAQYQLPPI